MIEIKPRTPREWALCRARLACKCGQEALEKGLIPADDYTVGKALYYILRILDDMVIAMENQDER
jgi:hypothetical protein